MGGQKVTRISENVLKKRNVKRSLMDEDELAQPSTTWRGGRFPSDGSFEIEDDKREIVASLNIIFTHPRPI